MERNEGLRGSQKNATGGVMELVRRVKCSPIEGLRASAMRVSREDRAVRDEAPPREAADAVSGVR